MDAERFEQARDALGRLLSANVQSLSTISSNIRQDGLPQDWVDDIPNLTTDQKAAIVGDIPPDAPAWAEALRAHLKA